MKKTKKALKFLAITFIMVLCMAGCGKEQDEFVEYLNGDARKAVTDLEKKAKESYSSVSAENFTDDQTMLQEISTNTSDLVNQAVDKAEKLGKTLEGEDLKKVHEIYVTALKDMQSGIDTLITALEEEDADKMDTVNEYITKGNDEYNKYMEELKKLGDDLGVEVTTNE